MIIAEHGKGAVISGARAGADALGDLLLHHDRDGLKGFGFKQLREHRGGDIVGQIGAGKRPQTGKALLYQCGEIQLHRIGVLDLKVVERPDGLLQDRPESLVDLDRKDLRSAQTELLRQGAEARTNLKHGGSLIRAGFFGDPLRDPGCGQKILALGFGKAEARRFQKGLHGLYVAEIEHGISSGSFQAAAILGIFYMILPEKETVFLIFPGFFFPRQVIGFCLLFRHPFVILIKLIFIWEMVALNLSGCKAARTAGDWIRRLILSWLAAVFVTYTLLPTSEKSLKGVSGVAAVSPLLMLCVGAAVFAALVVFGLNRDTVRAERWALFGLGSAVFAVSGVMNPRPAYLAAAALLIAVLFLYARKGWNAKPDAPAEAAPDADAGHWKIYTAIAAVVSFLVLSLWGVARVRSLSSPTYDFGIFSQMFESMRRTGEPVTTLERDGLLSHFAVHVSPIYYLLLPFYMIWPHPETLNVLQAALMTLSVIPLWLLAARFGYAPKYRFLLCVVLLAYPTFLGGNNFDLHENAFLTVLLLWLFYAAKRGSLPLTLLFALLTLAVKEDAAVYVAVFGLFLCVHALLHPENHRKTLWIGLCLIAAAVAYFLVVTNLLRTRGDGVMNNRYENMMFNGSNSLVSVVLCVLISPMKALYECTDADKLRCVYHAFLPLLLIPLLTRKYERYLLLIPLILINLLSDYPCQHSLYFQYNFGTAAFLILLYLLNWKDLLPRLRGRFRTLPLILTILVCLLSFSMTLGRKLVKYTSRWAKYDSECCVIREKLSQLPEDAVITSNEFLTVPIAGCRALYDYGFTTEEQLLHSEYVVVAMDGFCSWYGQEDTQRELWKQLVSKLEANGFVVVDEYGDWLRIYRKS